VAKQPLSISVWSTMHGDAVAVNLVADGSHFANPFGGDYSWRLRAVIEHAGIAHAFYAGDDSDQNHEPISEFPPFLHAPWFRAGAGPIEVLVELRVRRGRQSDTFKGRATFAPGERATIEASGAGKLVGPPFDAPAEMIERNDGPPDFRLDAVIVPDVGLVAYERETAGDFDARGTKLALYAGDTAAGGPRKQELYIPGNTITPEGAKYPTNWRHFDRLDVGTSGWIVLRRTQRDPWRNSFTALDVRRPERRIDIDANHLHAAFELTGEAFWFTVGGELRILHLPTGEVITLDEAELIRQFPYGGAIHVDGPLLCAFVGEQLRMMDWRTREVVATHAVPSFEQRPLFRVDARRIAWIVRGGNVQGPMSMVRWMELDAAACGEQLLPDMLLEATMLDDGRDVASGKLATWLVEPAEGGVARLGPPVRGTPVVTGTRGQQHRWHYYDRETTLVVEL
jgi:hypothetical protein